MKGKTMTQRIFDTDNEQDMADLWDILPDEVKKIERICDVWFTNDKTTWIVHAIKIDFHDTAEMPDFDRTVWLVKKDRNGKNDWWTVDLSKAEKGLFLEQWFKDLCDKNKFFAWSYRPYGVRDEQRTGL